MISSCNVSPFLQQPFDTKAVFARSESVVDRSNVLDWVKEQSPIAPLPSEHLAVAQQQSGWVRRRRKGSTIPAAANSSLRWREFVAPLLLSVRRAAS